MPVDWPSRVLKKGTLWNGLANKQSRAVLITKEVYRWVSIFTNEILLIETELQWLCVRLQLLDTQAAISSEHSIGGNVLNSNWWNAISDMSQRPVFEHLVSRRLERWRIHGLIVAYWSQISILPEEYQKRNPRAGTWCRSHLLAF